MNVEPVLHSYTLTELASLAASPYTRDVHSPLAQQPFLAVDLTKPAPPLNAERELALFGWLQQQPCPTIAVATAPHPLTRAFDVLLPDNRDMALLAANIARNPLAAMVLVQVLRSTETQPAAAALLLESLGYATLQTGPEFMRWLATRPTASATPHYAEPPLLVERNGAILRLRLNRPTQRNAIAVAMRDALYEALQLALCDASITRIIISGNGSCFSIGGALEEFGSVADASTAHMIRSLRLPANLLVQLGARLEFHLHSACIGAGMEIPAFGGRVTATANTFFQLPELRFGLIPGAGGCISVPRRIGRQRAAYMALTMKKIKAPIALAWGLIDEISD